MTESFSSLPYWLAHPVVIPSDYSSSNDPADLKIFESLGISGLFPFQSHVRERLRGEQVEGQRDFCVSAPTGSGKTLAYVLPIVERLQSRIVGRLRALVVVPTRDLIPQVEDTFKRVCEAYSCGEKLKCGLDYVVTTPGKLMDILPTLNSAALNFLVVDEADRLLDQSFQEWLPQLLDKLKLSKSSEEKNDDQFDTLAWNSDPESRIQKLLFSATLTTNPAKIAPLNLHRPVYLTVTGDETADHGASKLQTPEGLRELMLVFEGAEELKPAALLEVFESVLSGSTSLKGILCFTGSVSSTQSLTRLLSVMRPDLRISAFHGHLNDSERAALLTAFEAGSLDILIGSDAMARGLDLPGVRCVINYDVASFVGTYVHRVGRTARAGQSGLAVSLLPSSQSRHFKKLLCRAPLFKKIVPFNGRSIEELKCNEVGKVELSEEVISGKWKALLVDSLRVLKEERTKKIIE